MSIKLVYWNTLTETAQQNLLCRPFVAEMKGLETEVKKIVARVKSEGDQAVCDYTLRFDQVDLTAFTEFTALPKSMLQTAEDQLDESTKSAIKIAYQQIYRYQSALLPQPLLTAGPYDLICQRLPRAIPKVGLYVPGGSAPLLSTVLMLGVPAQLAECREVVLCTPPKKDGSVAPEILFAADLCGIEKIYRVGGAQSIAAMAYGTATIPKVDKIFGPGNRYVSQAKILVSQDAEGASIDLPAGPSELMIIADEKANASVVAADLLSQAEHGEDSQVWLLTTHVALAQAVQNAVQTQLAQLSRRQIAEKALAQSAIILVDNIKQALQLANQYAPEHLSLQLENPKKFLPQIENAGAVFMGYWMPETLGDYVTGANHVLPTGGWARSYSGLSVNDFVKYISVQGVSQDGLLSLAQPAQCLANIEGLQAHANAIKHRLSLLAAEQTP